MKPITKKRLKETRLKKLETEMFKKLSNSKKKMTAKELKAFFPNRASLATTVSILEHSEIIGMTALNNVGTIVTVTYSISNINLQNIYVGGDGSSSSSGTLSNVIMNADNSIDLEVNQNSPINQKYSFSTSYIGSITSEFIQTNKPIESDSVYTTIYTNKKP